MRKLMILVGALLARPPGAVSLSDPRPSATPRLPTPSKSASCSTSADWATSRSTTALTAAHGSPRQKLGATIRLIEPGEAHRPRGRPARARRRAHGPGDRRRLHLHRRHHAARPRISRTSDFADVDYALSTDASGTRHPAAGEPRGAQVPGGGRLVPRRRTSPRWWATRREWASSAAWTSRSSTSSKPATAPA